MNQDPSWEEAPQEVEYGTGRSYLLGFIGSVLLTALAYWLATHPGFFANWVLDVAITALALAQALLQLFLFLNLTREPTPRWNLITFLFMASVVLILVFGSLWIMTNLNYHLML